MISGSNFNRIHTAAVEYGWQRGPDRSDDVATYRKGDQLVYVEFSTIGGVSYASLNDKRAIGADKADQVIAWLSA
jgi:hypothetical protein